jgi:hypothetical protein
MKTMNQGMTMDDVQISLHAPTGFRTSKTMQLRVLVNSEPLMALVDSGSTHNCIAQDAPPGIQLEPRPRFYITVANGDWVASTGISRTLGVDISNEHFPIECYAIPLEGFEVVLYVQWLCSLGTILWFELHSGTKVIRSFGME